MYSKYCIPFDQLKDTMCSFSKDYCKFLSKEFTFKIEGKTFSICRQDGVNGDKSSCQDLLSDCAMELLAAKVKEALESRPDFKKEVLFSNDETRIYEVIYFVEAGLVGGHFGIPYDAELEHKTINPGEKCFDRKTIEYVTFICKVPDELVIDGENAIIRDESNNLRTAHMCELVAKY